MSTGRGFIWKCPVLFTLKKQILKISSAAIVTKALRVNILYYYKKNVKQHYEWVFFTEE